MVGWTSEQAVLSLLVRQRATATGIDASVLYEITCVSFVAIRPAVQDAEQPDTVD